MGKYKLCLVCSSNFYKPLIDNEFNSIEDIDDFTEQFKNEDSFRNDPVMSKRLASIYTNYYYYFAKIPDKVRRKGTIAIVKLDAEDFSYVLPAYKDNNGIRSPKRLAGVIISTLRKKNNGKYLTKFVIKYSRWFITEYTKISGIKRYKSILETVDEPITEEECEAYKELLDLMKFTIMHHIDKKNDTVNERPYFAYRKMYDDIKELITIKKFKINNPYKMRRVKLDIQKSEMIVKEQEKIQASKEVAVPDKKMTEEEVLRDLVERAYMKSLENGEEPNLLGIYNDKELNKEYEESKWFYHDKR